MGENLQFISFKYINTYIFDDGKTTHTINIITQPSDNHILYYDHSVQLPSCTSYIMLFHHAFFLMGLVFDWKKVPFVQKEGNYTSFVIFYSILEFFQILFKLSKA